MNDNVVSFASRKPLAQEQAEQAAIAAHMEEEHEKALTSHQEVCLKMLDDVRRLVELGRLQGIVLFGKDPESGLFLTEVALDNKVTPPSELFSYVGAIETLKLELADAASMSPTITSTGDVLDPWSEATQDDLEDDE